MLDKKYSIHAGESLVIDSGELVSDLTTNNQVLSLFVRGNTNINGQVDISGLTAAYKISPTMTYPLVEGTYRLYEVLDTMVNDSVDSRNVLSESELLVMANMFDLNEPFDGRSFNQKMVEAIEAYILGMATNDQIDHIKAVESHRELQRMGARELQKLLDLYKNRLYREQNPGKGAHIARNISYRFLRT